MGTASKIKPSSDFFAYWVQKWFFTYLVEKVGHHYPFALLFQRDASMKGKRSTNDEKVPWLHGNLLKRHDGKDLGNGKERIKQDSQELTQPTRDYMSLSPVGIFQGHEGPVWLPVKMPSKPMVFFLVGLDTHRTFTDANEFQWVFSKLLGYGAHSLFAVGFNLRHLAPDLFPVDDSPFWSQTASSGVFFKEDGFPLYEVVEVPYLLGRHELLDVTVHLQPSSLLAHHPAERTNIRYRASADRLDGPRALASEVNTCSFYNRYKELSSHSSSVGREWQPLLLALGQSQDRPASETAGNNQSQSFQKVSSLAASALL